MHDLFTCSGSAIMATAIEILRQQNRERAVYARFTSAVDPRLKAVLRENAWLLAKHAVLAVMDAEASLAAAGAVARPGGSTGEPGK
jgi:hypothetical protein